MQVSRRAMEREGKSTRCPYCFENLAPGDNAPRQECPDCQAPHHASCWSELGGCAACRLVAEAPVETPSQEGFSKGLSPRDRRREVRRLLEENERGFEFSFLDFVFSPLTIMVHPVLASETRLQNHLVSNLESYREVAGVEPSEKRALVEATELAIADSKRRRFRMKLVFSGLMLVPISALTILASWMFRYDSDEIAAGLLVVGSGVWIVAILTHMIAHWRAYRQHEAKQLTFGVMSRDLTEGQTAQSIQQHQTEWKRSSWILGIGTVISAITWFLFPLWVVLGYRLPRKLHDQRELKVVELSAEEPRASD